MLVKFLSIRELKRSAGLIKIIQTLTERLGILLLCTSLTGQSGSISSSSVYTYHNNTNEKLAMNFEDTLYSLSYIPAGQFAKKVKLFL